METDIKTVMGLFLFIVIGMVLLGPIMTYISNVTTPTIQKTLSNGTVVTQANPSNVGQTVATLVSLVPLFYILVLLIVPAVMGYKLFKDRE